LKIKKEIFWHRNLDYNGKAAVMENLTYPKSTGVETNKWPEKSFGGPSKPKTNQGFQEPTDISLFLHPAEKPQFNEPVYRTRLYDTF